MEQFTIAEITVQYKPKKADRPKITDSYEGMTAIRQFFPEDTIELQERFVVIYMNKANRVIGAYTASIGGITATVVDVRLILSVALKVAATNLLLAHNHPSGNLQPSKADVQLTRKMKEAASYFDMLVFDHLILAPDGRYYSFAEEGII